MEFFKNKKSDNQQRLNAVLTKVKLLAQSNDVRDHKAIFYIVKIYADYVNSLVNTQLLQGKTAENILNDVVLTDTASPITLNHSYNIALGKFPIVTTMWDENRQIKALAQIGDDNKWREDPINHFYELFLPIGLIVVYNGNHSTNSGIIKSTGLLEIKPHKSNSSVYDISHLYNRIYFNGDSYIETSTNRKIYHTKFEYGCMFEIGRIINKYGISFLDLFSDS